MTADDKKEIRQIFREELAQAGLTYSGGVSLAKAASPEQIAAQMADARLQRFALRAARAKKN